MDAEITVKRIAAFPADGALDDEVAFQGREVEGGNSGMVACSMAQFMLSMAEMGRMNKYIDIPKIEKLSGKIIGVSTSLNFLESVKDDQRYMDRFELL